MKEILQRGSNQGWKGEMIMTEEEVKVYSTPT